MNKRKIIFIIAAAIFGVLLCIFIFINTGRKETKADETVPLLQEDELSAQEQKYRDENVSLFENTISSEDDVIEQEQRIDITNMEVMAERGYSQESIDALIPYLNAYFNYYDPDGDNYTAVIDVSGGNLEQYPHFYIKVNMHETDFWIECIYFKSDHEYVFYSDFGDPFAQ